MMAQKKKVNMKGLDKPAIMYKVWFSGADIVFETLDCHLSSYLVLIKVKVMAQKEKKKKRNQHRRT